MKKTWKLSEQQRATLPDLYRSGLSTTAIGSALGVSPQSVYRLLRSRGVEIRTDRRTLTCRDDFFDVIDDDPKAYWLGFLMADGTIGRNAVVVSLATKDSEHLARLKRDLEASNPIRVYRYGRVSFARLAITSRRLTQALTRHGVVAWRVWTVGIPALPGEWLGAFVRGYYDGNGSIGEYACRQRPPYRATRRHILSITGGQHIIADIVAECQRRNILAHVIRDHSVWRLSIDARKHLIPFRDWLYVTGGPCLPRKYEPLAALDG